MPENDETTIVASPETIPEPGTAVADLDLRVTTRLNDKGDAYIGRVTLAGQDVFVGESAAQPGVAEANAVTGFAHALRDVTRRFGGGQ